MKKNSCAGQIKRLDILGPKLEFSIKGKDRYQTYFGAAITVISLFLVILYGAYQFQVMI